jgi:hypothetical protein
MSMESVVCAAAAAAAAAQQTKWRALCFNSQRQMPRHAGQLLQGDYTRMCQQCKHSHTQQMMVAPTTTAAMTQYGMHGLIF